MTHQEQQHLSEHFILYEFTRSGTAIEHEIANIPNLQQEQALRLLCINILEPLRQRFGPVVISSGFRCRRLNTMVGGVPSSQHLRGEAVDIIINDVERGIRMYEYIRHRLDFDQLIWEPMGAEVPQWLHVSYTTRHRNRHMVL